MTEQPKPSFEQLERELQFYRAEYNTLGAQRVRIQEQLSQVTREARRSKIVAKLIREATGRHAPPRETCKLIGDYSAAEISMMKYVAGNAVACQIPASFAEQLKLGHKNTEAMLMRVCAAAEQDGRRGPLGQINDLGDPAFMQNHAANHLDVEMALPKRAFASLAHRCEGGDQ